MSLVWTEDIQNASELAIQKEEQKNGFICGSELNSSIWAGIIDL